MFKEKKTITQELETKTTENSEKSKDKKKKATEKDKIIKALKRLSIKIISLIIIVLILILYVGGIFICHDNNMYPHIKDGDLAITYKLGGYYNGDIVLYEIDNINRFGRVVGIAGDTIDISNEGSLIINGTIPYETVYYSTYKANNSNITFPYTVKDGEVFILNDLRENASDSRIYGGISSLKGKVVLLLRRRGF